MAEKDEKNAAEEKDPKEGEEPVEGEGEEGAEGEKKKFGKKKLMIIGAAALLLVLGSVGAAGYFLGWFGGGGEQEEAEGGEHAGGDAGKAVKGVVAGRPMYYEMPEMLVNLNTGSKQSSFLKMKITLELADAGDVQTIEAHMPHITDALNTYLRELRSSDLAGSAGLYRLKEELLLRINNAIQPTQVKDVLFRDILIQ